MPKRCLMGGIAVREWLLQTGRKHAHLRIHGVQFCYRQRKVTRGTPRGAQSEKGLWGPRGSYEDCVSAFAEPKLKISARIEPLHWIGPVWDGNSSCPERAPLPSHEIGIAVCSL